MEKRSRSSVPRIEFLRNRIYLGAYSVPPADTAEFVHFTVEDSLPYNPFHLDFGPLNVGALYRFAVSLHNLLNDPKNQGKAIVLYSSLSPKHRANAACLLCCYMVLVQSWSPHQVLQPIAQVLPPFQSFRDAGYSNADYEITIQDIVYGMWRAKERGMIDLTAFNLEEYEQYERVDQGDFNVLSKDFIAFASPQQSSRTRIVTETFTKVLDYFVDNDVQLVFRLNSHLYDAQEFTKRGIQHVDMIFDDGTCPTMDFVKKFIGAAECVINRGGKIAVHCKAGLGRTGCLIGAHLIYTHGFTANECIGYMRMIRPGMVVGPQQHWLYLHQHDFRDWRHTMVLDNRPDPFIGGLFSLCPYDEFKARLKQEARERKQQQQQQQQQQSHSFSQANTSSHFDSSYCTPIRRRKISGVLTAKIHTAVPMISPGQPRKYNEFNDLENNITDVHNNSDEDGAIEIDSALRRTTRDGMSIESEMNSKENSVCGITSAAAAGIASTSSPKNENVSGHSAPHGEWKVLRSISVNSGATSPPQMIKNATASTTSRNVSSTLLSPHSQSPYRQGLKVSKSRQVSRTSLGLSPTRPTYASPSRQHSGGIRKISNTSPRVK